MNLKRTELALLARGIDTETADRVVKNGLTIEKLRRKTEEELRRLGVPNELVSSFELKSRTSIPFNTAGLVLFRNRYACCVCRNSNRSVILHHISPWAKSKDHNPSNLAVLCLEHHDKAHSTSSLSQNLNPKTLRLLKNKWEKECENNDSSLIIESSIIDYDCWLYFNHKRLFEIADEMKIPFKKLEGFNQARSEKLIDNYGNILPRDPQYNHMYHSANGTTLYHYTKSVMTLVLERIPIINFSDLFDRGNVSRLLCSGQFILVQGAHVFKRLSDVSGGQNEVFQGSRSVNHVEIRYVFNRWEATSMSAWSCWLVGRRSVASLVQVKEIVQEKNHIVILATVIAISNGHRKLKQRSYSAFDRYYCHNSRDELDDNFDEFSF